MYSRYQSRIFCSCFCIEDGECLSEATTGVKWNRSSGNLYPDDLSDNVGIGTDSPSGILNVVGNIDFEGILNMTGNAIENVSEINPNRNTSFGGGIEMNQDEKHCFDGSTCERYITYNGSTTIIT